MEDTDDPINQAGFETVDPTLRAYIYGLVSALGGLSSDDPNVYLLGDDVLGCLRDIKRWLKGYDEKLNRLDVARCLSEANIVAGDLVEILSHSPIKDDTAFNQPNKISLACVELLVPLTWPLDKTDLSMTINHHRHIAVLKRSQIQYKRCILSHSSKSILKACCVNALPPMAIAMRERTNRDEGIIRLILYFIRNLLRIESLANDHDDLREDVSRSSTIDSFEEQGVLKFLLSIASGVPETFEQQDVIILEILFHMLKGIDLYQLPSFSTSAYPKSGQDRLSQMLKREEGLKSTRSVHTNTRHNRFGTIVMMQKENGQRAVLSGQGALVSEDTGLKKLDATKKWRKPQHIGKKHESLFGTDVTLTSSAGRRLQNFLIQILQSGFNSLFQSIRKAIERDSERVLSGTHPTQLFYTASFVLEFNRKLKREDSESEKSAATNYGAVAALLHQETFIILFRHIRENLELKAWDDVQAGCLYFTQVLLTVSEMVQSKDSVERLVAENILSRLFYEESLQDLMVATLRAGSKRSLQYLNTITQLIHVYLRSLERYSKENTNMVVKSKRRNTSHHEAQANDSDEDTEVPSRRTAAEKKFEFLQCESKFLSQSCIDPFVEFLGYYKELDSSQVKRCISFLHRIFVKREMTIPLFQLKTIHLLYTLAKDTEGLSEYTDVSVFFRYFVKHLTRKLNAYPVLFVELLFHKSSRTSYFLQFGKEKDMPIKRARPPPRLEIKPGLDKQTQIGIAVAAVLQDESCAHQLDWIKSVLTKTAAERLAWEMHSSASRITEESLPVPEAVVEPPMITIKFDDQGHGLQHFMSNKLQLLMNLLDFETTGTSEEDFTYTLPPSISAAAIRENLEVLIGSIESPITVLESGEDAAEWIRKQRKSRVTRDLSSDDAGNSFSDPNDEFLFPDNLPEKNSKRPKGKSERKPRRKEALDDTKIAARREQRRMREIERRRGIKSALYIASSDDDSDMERDREFFEKEQILREAMSKATIDPVSDIPQAAKKRSPVGEPRRKSKRPKTMSSNPRSDSADDTEDTNPHSSNSTNDDSS